MRVDSGRMLHQDEEATLSRGPRRFSCRRGSAFVSATRGRRFDAEQNEVDALHSSRVGSRGPPHPVASGQMSTPECRLKQPSRNTDRQTAPRSTPESRQRQAIVLGGACTASAELNIAATVPDCAARETFALIRRRPVFSTCWAHTPGRCAGSEVRWESGAVPATVRPFGDEPGRLLDSKRTSALDARAVRAVAAAGSHPPTAEVEMTSARIPEGGSRRRSTHAEPSREQMMRNARALRAGVVFAAL
jgi:hypothetical protein